MLKVYNPEKQCPECRGTGEYEVEVATDCKDVHLWEKYKIVPCSE
jgi:hypothetical protein